MKSQQFELISFIKQFFLLGFNVLSPIFSIFLVTGSYAQQVINHRDSIIKHLVGEMSAFIEQEQSSPTQVRMTTCFVNVKGDRNSAYLYQEQGFIDSLDRPYRQRFLEITTDNNQNNQLQSSLVFSHSYKPKNLKRWTNFCQSDRLLNQLNPSDLGQLVCTVTLKPLLNIYLGQTPPEGCPTTARGAKTITNSIILHQQGMETWDRGFDNEGKQLWGARKQPYQFFWDKGE